MIGICETCKLKNIKFEKEFEYTGRTLQGLAIERKFFMDNLCIDGHKKTKDKCDFYQLKQRFPLVQSITLKIKKILKGDL